MNKLLKELMKESLKYKTYEDFIQSMRIPAMLVPDFRLTREVPSLKKALLRLPKNKFGEKGINILEENEQLIPPIKSGKNLRGWFNLAEDLYYFARIKESWKLAKICI